MCLTSLHFSALTILIAGHEGRWVVAVALTVAFTLLARVVRGVTNSGAVAGAFSCFVLYVGGGPGAFAALITVFALAWITTRLGYARKQKLGTAERREGRKASQVLANLGVATPVPRRPSSVMTGQSFCWQWQRRSPKLPPTRFPAKWARPSGRRPAWSRPGVPSQREPMAG